MTGPKGAFSCMNILFKYLGQYKKTIFLSLVFATVNQVFSLLDPQIFRLIIDNYATQIHVLSKEEFVKGILFLLLLSILAALVSRIAKNFQDYFVSVVTQRVGTKMYADSVDYSFSLPYAVFEDQRSGEILRKMEKAKTDSQTLISSFINVFFLAIVGLIFVISYAFWVHWSIGLTYLAIVPAIGAVTFFISKKIKEAQKLIVMESASLAGQTTETIRNVELVKSLGLEDQETNRLNDVNDKILSLELKKIYLIRLLSFFQGTMVNISRSLAMLLMFWLMFQGSMSLGQFFTLLFYSFAIFSPLYELGTVASQYQEAKASLEALEGVYKIKPEIKPKNPVVLENINNISFNNVSFLYNELNTHSVKDVSFEIKSGETIAFVGPSGAGKTTLLKLILGLYRPTDGVVSINGNNSLDIDSASFKTKVGYVSQDSQLFSGTIKDNLLFIKPDATDEECLRALENAEAKKIIERGGGEGLLTKIGEGGIKLSGGERQRLAIARSLLRNPEVIIFDEATSSLDSITEASIAETMRGVSKKYKNLITILVAHRLSTVSHADRIYVLEKGSVVEVGNHNELVEKGGLYSALWREQVGV